MKTQSEKPFANAMAFYHDDGLPAAWKQAMKFAGQGGRLATMPDIIAARIETQPGDMPWETYFTTLTAEYYGISQRGVPILIGRSRYWPHVHPRWSPQGIQLGIQG
jgi:hypothetical protein